MTHRDTPLRRPQLPTGWRRLAIRLPILFFRAGLGPLFGKRLLLLHHTGRVSGLDRMVVLEVVSYNPGGASWTVASGFGPNADWYRNLRARPKTLIQFGNRPHAVTAHFLTPEEGAEIMLDYARRHPRTARRLCAFMELPVDGSESSYQEAGRAVPFVRLDSADEDRRARARTRVTP
ncbi:MULTISPECIES: nitroreductase family deazaflavin-dependent oxidoreductase [unclassified Streptomyces]|uniref:nitroreductase family deazaflavin-dependent oxidoreductase n=1 Tax=unclassified Streptomyces TaxID=2593676 RepID=UPI0014888318|nr:MULTISPECIES: nitroreductase family deazaflavin-dependent oxidoreductase [unclassified Streptomyces]